MKKLSFILAAIAIIAVSACSNEQTPVKKDLTITVKAKTSVKYDSLTTAPRTACSGEIMQYPKVTGKKLKVIPVTTTKDTTITSSDLEKMGYYYGGSNGAKVTTNSDGTIAGLPGWFNDIFWPLLAALILVLLAMLIWWMITSFNRYTQRESTPVQPVVTPPSAPVTKNDDQELYLYPVINITVSPSAKIGDIIINTADGTVNGSRSNKDNYRSFSRTPGKTNDAGPRTDASPETQK